MKLKIKIIGQTAFLVIMAPLSLTVPFLFLNGINPELREQSFWLAWFLGLFVFTIFWLWNLLLTRLIIVELTESELNCLNIITRKRWTIRRDEIAGFKYDFSQGYTIYLIGHNQQVLLTLSQHFFLNLKEFEQELGFFNFGKRANLLSRIIKRLGNKTSSR